MTVGIARLLTETVSVKTKSGGGFAGPTFGAAVDVLVFPNDGVRQVRASDGVETVSQTTLYASLADIDKFTPGSEVTGHGRTSEVITVIRREVGPPGAWHAQIALT